MLVVMMVLFLTNAWNSESGEQVDYIDPIAPLIRSNDDDDDDEAFFICHKGGIWEDRRKRSADKSLDSAIVVLFKVSVDVEGGSSWRQWLIEK